MGSEVKNPTHKENVARRYPLVNIGCGEGRTITELALTVAQALG